MKTFKHLFTVLLLLCSITASAHDFEVDGIYYKITDESNKTVSVTYEGSSYNYQPEYNEYTGDVVLQPTVMYGGNTYNVTGIADNAFEYCANLQSVTIPSSIKSIGYRSFENCLSLQTVNLSEGLTSIGVCAFQYCTKLTAIVIPSSVTTISNYAFRDCPKLESVTFCAQVAPTVATDVFTRISSTAVLKYPAGSDYSLWSGYFARTEEFAATIGGSCGANVNWTLEGDVLTISGSGNMDDYSSDATPWNKYKLDIKTVIIESGVTSIGDYAFARCDGLTSITIPNSVTSIGGSAFAQCNELTSVEIPSSVTNIGVNAFQYCYRLASIVVDEGNTVYDSRDNCNAIINTASNAVVLGCYNTTIPNSVTSIGYYAFSGCFWLTSIEIPNGVTSIGNGAFSECYELSNIVIPSSVTSIDINAFGLCGKLTSVTSHILADNLFYTNAFDGLNLDACTLYVPYGAKETYASTYGWNAFTNIVELEPEVIGGSCGANVNWTFENGVLTITGNGAMDDYTAPWMEYAALITNVVIEDGVTKIGESAFSGCSALTSIVIPNSVTHVGQQAFDRCTALESVTIGSGVKSGFFLAFNGCSKLTSITSLIPAEDIFGITGDPGDSYWGLSDKERCTLYVPYGAKATYAKTAPWSEFANIVEMVDGTCGENTTWTLKGNTLIIGGSGAVSDFYTSSAPWYKYRDIIEVVVVENGVTRIGNNAFYGYTSLKNLCFATPNSVTSIGSQAFSGCSGLNGDLVIPNSVTSIGSGAFSGCSGLTSLTIGCGVISIEDAAFKGCTSLTDLRIEDGEGKLSLGRQTYQKAIFYDCPLETLYLGRVLSYNTHIDYGLSPFYNKTTLKSVVIGNTVTSIGSSAFSDCSGLSSLTIGNSVTSIGSGAFTSCKGLTGELVIPDNVTSIGSYAFSRCSNLTSIEIPNSVISIGDYAFNDCPGLAGDLVIPNSVTTIGSSAFQFCSGLTRVAIGAGVTTIGSSAFYRCSGMLSLTIGRGVTRIGNSAFDGCTSLKDLRIEDGEGAISVSSSQMFKDSPLETMHLGRDLSYSVVSSSYDSPFSKQISLKSVTIGDCVTSIGDKAFYGCTGLTGDLVIPNNVTAVGSSAFSNCTGLTNMTIGSGVTFIGYGAFYGCTSLKNVRFEDGEGAISVNSQMFKDSPLETMYLGRDLSYSNTPFTNQISLKSVTIGDCVTTIGSQAFYGCTGLTSLTIGNSVTTIGSQAFYGCTGLTGEFVFPNSVTTIGYRAFCNCTGLSSLTIGGSVASIESCAFDGCTSLTDLRIEDGEGVLRFDGGGGSDKGMFTGSPLESLYLGRDIAKMVSDNRSPFHKCKTLTNVIISDNVTSIGVEAFNGCSGIKSIVLPDGVTTIGSQAFRDCSGLTGELVIPKNVTSIGSSAFYNCTGLTGELVIPNSVVSIGGSAFSGCKGLKNMTIGSGVTSIGSSAFSDCTGLSGGLVIPDSVVSIGGYAFNGCSVLSSLTIGNCVETIGSKAFNNCTGLKDVYISDIAAWCNIDFGDAYSTPLYYAGNLYLNDELVTEINIPEGVESVKNYAFYYYSKLTNVTIPSSVTAIGTNAFNKANAVIEIANETPATLGSGIFASNAVLVVPSVSVDEYKTAWNSYATQIVGKDDAIVSVDVKAKEGTSGIMEKLGLDKVGSVTKLTVKGSVNSYDVIQFRDKMPLLRELDLSEATVVASDKAFYNGNSTKDNNLGNYAFYGLSKLNYVKLPNDLVSIGSYTFNGCSSLRKLEIPETVQSVGQYAFYKCTSLTKVEMPQEIVSIGERAFYSCSSLEEIVISGGIKSLSAYTFSGCSRLKNITLPNGLESIGENAFNSCSALNGVKLPPTIKTIAQTAFSGCSSLEEIRIPSSVENIGAGAFQACSRLNKVYTYTVEPTAIKENTFSTFATATLYVPSFSFSNYYWDDGWKRFLNLEEFNEPYEYFYVNNDYILDENTGYIEGTEDNAPDADINAGGGFIVEGEQGDDETPNQSLGNVNVGCDGNGNSGSIIGDNNLHIDDLHIKIDVKGGRWYFFAFPFDIKMDKISMQNGSDYVFRYYDGEERATKGNGGWKDVNESHLKAARGYIFQCSASDVLVLSIEDVKFKKEDKYNELVAHVSENLKDASWNFVGNPYLSYYDMADMGYTAPVTVWDGSKYVAIRPGDDDYHFAPYEAFFVQKPEGQEAIGFDGEEQMTKNQSEKKMEKQAAARRARSVDTERLLVNIVLGDGATSDRTRIVFNERQSLAYETSCDATKFSTAGVVQLYTIGSDNVHYAINERPAGNGVVMLGYTAPTAGFYTIEAQRMDAEVFVKDYKTGTLHNLKDGAYSFSTDAGTFNDRFEILLKGTAPGTTGIDDVEAENGEVKGEIYDLQGRKMQDAEKGIYIINGEKVMK